MVYDSRFRDKDIHGYVGGGPARPHVHVRSKMRLALFEFDCPACGLKAIGGKRVCLSCSCIFLFAGNDRLYSPILHGVVELLPGDVASTVKLSPEVHSRIVAFGGKNRGMSVR